MNKIGLRIVSTFLCFISSGVQMPSLSWAESVSSGQGGSIIVEALDPKTGNPIPDGLLKPGMEVRLDIRAYDSAGKPVTCTPTYGVQQGVTGNQIDGEVDPASNTFKMGPGFGSAAIQVRCAELPDVRADLNVRNHPPLGQNQPAPQQAASAAEAASGSGGAGGAVIAGVLLGAAAIAGALVLASSLSETGEEDCSTRTCVKGISCSCSGSSYTTCDGTLPVRSSGRSCTSGNTRVAWCSEGLACVNGTCSSSCN